MADTGAADLEMSARRQVYYLFARLLYLYKVLIERIYDERIAAGGKKEEASGA
ncbi:MAG: hypothetical protein HXS52_09790 [Theionarchaea archaeon]|nr:hypothetical protein [Theionarchaea archaeon]